MPGPTCHVLGCHAFCNVRADIWDEQKARQPAGETSSFRQYALDEIVINLMGQKR